MNDELLASIRAANLEFQEFARLVTPGNGGDQKIDDAFRRLNKIHLRLKHISKCLAATPASLTESPEDAAEFERYRVTLQALKGAVENLQEKFLAEKARINNVRSNVQAARAWADSIRSYCKPS